MKASAAARTSADPARPGSDRDASSCSAATPAFTPASKGRVRPHARLLGLLAISLVALFASTASAPAAGPTTTTPVISNVSYTSAHVTGKVTSPQPGGFGTGTYTFQYATSQSGPWTDGYSEFWNGPLNEQEVSGDLKNLEGGTQYFVRLTASAFFTDEGFLEGVSPEPNPSFTTVIPDPPTIPGAVVTSEIFSMSAEATGEINRPVKSDDVSCNFEYITDEAFSNNPPGEGFVGATPVGCEPENPVKATGNVPVSAKLNGLSPSTTYHLRLVVDNAAPGVVTKDGANFTTAAKVAAPTVTATDDATEVKFNSAKFTGKVLRPAGADPALDLNCHFEYISDAAFNATADEHQSLYVFAASGTYTLGFGGQSTPAIAFDASATEVETQLNALSSVGGTGGSVAVAGGPGDESGSSPYAFTFGGSLSETDVEQLSVDPTNLSSQFAYVETTLEGRSPGFSGASSVDCAENPITAAKVDGAGEIGVSAKAGLIPETKYHFRLVAENEGGTDSKEPADTFTTPEAELPTVTIDPVEGGTFTTAHVTGTVTLADGHTTAAEGIVQVSSDGGTTWSSTGMFRSEDGQNFDRGQITFGHEGLFLVRADLTGLQPSTTYLFRIAASYNPEFTTNGGPGIPVIEANGEVALLSRRNHHHRTSPDAPHRREPRSHRRHCHQRPLLRDRQPQRSRRPA